MSYPTPREFVEALVAHPNIASAEISVTLDVSAKDGYESGVGERGRLAIVADTARVSAETGKTYVLPVDLSDGRIIRAWFPDDAPHWAAVALAAVRDGWPA